MKKLILLAILFCTATFCYAQDDAYESSRKNSKQVIPKDFRINYDKFEKTSWVKNKPDFAGRNYYTVGAYFELKDDVAKNLRLTLYYSGREWVFFEDVKFLINDETIELPVNKSEREAILGGVVEISDTPVSKEVMVVLKKLLKVEKAQIRFVGDKYSDKVIYKTDINNIRKIVEYYELLGGKL